MMNASSSACSTDAAHTTCAACAHGVQNSDPAAAVEAMTGIFDGYSQLNTPACIEIVGGDAACAAKYDAYMQCTETACAPCADIATYNACLDAVDTGLCASYWDAAAACGNALWDAIWRCQAGTWDELYDYHVANVCGYTPNTTTCAPYLPDAASVIPAYVPASGIHQNKCTAAQVSAAYAACQGDAATTATCSAFYQANTDCYECLDASSETALGPTYGVYAGEAYLTNLNGPGCLELYGASSCAQQFQALMECTRLACTPNCPVVDGASWTALDQCETDAKATTCLALETSFNSCWAALPAATQDACTFATWEDGYNKYGVLFCGP